VRVREAASDREAVGDGRAVRPERLGGSATNVGLFFDSRQQFAQYL
jgi:hypothetical protein